MRLDAASPRTWLLATVAGWAVLAWLLALAGMGRQTRLLDDDAGLVQALPQSRAPAKPRIGPLTQYGEIAARPLLMDDRRPRAFFVQGKGDETAQANTFDYVLTSVLITPDLKMAILQPADGSESVRVKLGEVPESHPAWRLSALDPRKAVFEGPEGRREMDLRVYDGQGGQPPTAVAVPVPPPNQAGPGTRAPPPPPQPQPQPQPVARSTAGPMPSTNPPGQVAPVTNSNTVVSPAGSEPMTEQAQMEAIRKRIEARRAQLRQQQAQQPPAKTP